MNLNFSRGPKAYLDVGPMVSIEQQRILSHHLHLSCCIQLEDASSPCLQPVYNGNRSFASGNEDSSQLVVIQLLLDSSLQSSCPVV